MEKRKFIWLAAVGLVGLAFPELLLADLGLDIIDTPSRKRKTRANRLSTSYFALHTTEGGFESSLNKLMRIGGANYLINTNGSVRRIMGRNQISNGLGRSMWNGISNLDNHTINIEFVGTYTEEPTREQLRNGRRLIAELRTMHPNVKDNEILPHSMLAYGTPNKQHLKSHRGRKKGCGVLFAREDIREKLGIGPAPYFDPDVMAGRLIVGNPDLESALYHNGPTPPETWPNEYERIISIINNGDVWPIAGNEYASATTLYFFEDGVRTGAQLTKGGFDFNVFPAKIEVGVGYAYGGYFTKTTRNPGLILGKDWNLPSTFYRFPNKAIRSGDGISGLTIPEGTFFFFRA